MTRFVLASSPLVGPPALGPLARSLIALGAEAVVPVAPADLDAHLAAIAEHTGPADGPTVLVAYSAAGPRANLLASALDPDAIVFLDARLPADGLAPDDEARFADFLDALPIDADGHLPPWSEWWPDGVLDSLCPDPERRSELVSGCPSLPRAMFSTPVPAPPFGGRCGYVLLDAGYADQAAAARSAGWPVVELPGATHLSPFVDPDRVATLVHAIADELV